SVGGRLFARPHSLWGKPVTSETLTTGRPASARARAVPPVETSSKPRSRRDWANGRRPDLSERLKTARRIDAWTPGKRILSEEQRGERASKQFTPNVTRQYHPQAVQVLRTSERP